MLNRHKDELSLEWDKRWEHLQLGKSTPFPAASFFLSRFLSFWPNQKIGWNQRLRLMKVCLWLTVLEVMQFARDAHMAEGWMIAQEPYLKNENLGVSDFLFSQFFRSRFYDKFRGLRERICCRTLKSLWVLVSQRFKLNVFCLSLRVFRPISMKSSSFWRNTQTSRS